MGMPMPGLPALLPRAGQKPAIVLDDRTNALIDSVRFRADDISNHAITHKPVEFDRGLAVAIGLLVVAVTSPLATTGLVPVWAWLLLVVVLVAVLLILMYGDAVAATLPDPEFPAQPSERRTCRVNPLHAEYYGFDHCPTCAKLGRRRL